MKPGQAFCDTQDYVSLFKDNPVIVIVGPTASGKSRLAQEIALALNGEVVSADSMQIYKGMDIATGKVLPDERKVVHYGLDIINPNEAYSAALFQDYARSKLIDIAQRGKCPILCGGTGFYVRATVDDYQFPRGEQENNELRAFHVHVIETEGAQALWDILNEKDPESAAAISPQNSKRVSRALEMNAIGLSYAHQVQQLQSIPELIPTLFIGLSVERDILIKRIDARVDSMLEDGLIEETQKLLKLGFKESLTASAAIGYHQIISYLDGQKSLEEAIEDIKISTRQYAKRQRSWFRKEKRIHWIDANDLDIQRMLSEALAFVSSAKL